MNDIAFDEELDVTGLSCPMPLIKSRHKINHLAAGQVLKLIATDRGTINDIKGWVKTSDNLELLAQKEDQTTGQHLYLHFIKKLH